MQWLQRLLPKLLVIGAIGVVLVALFCDHKTEYGSVTLPRGGVVTLPEGTVNVFVDENPAAGREEDDSARPPGGPQRRGGVRSSGGEALVRNRPPTAAPSTSSPRAARRSARAAPSPRLRFPQSGAYRISGSMADDSSVEIGFGLNAFRAVADQWKLIAGLLAGAFLISLIRLPKRRSSEELDAAAYARPVSPYRG